MLHLLCQRKGARAGAVCDVMSMQFLQEDVLVCGDTKGHVGVWDMAPATRRELQRVRGHEGEVLDLAVSPQGRLVSAGRDGRVLLYDGSTLATTCLTSGQYPVLSCAVNDEHMVVALDVTGIDVWDVRERTRRARVHAATRDLRCVCFASDKKLLVAAANRVVTVDLRAASLSSRLEEIGLPTLAGEQRDGVLANPACRAPVYNPATGAYSRPFTGMNYVFFTSVVQAPCSGPETSDDNMIL